MQFISKERPSKDFPLKEEWGILAFFVVERKWRTKEYNFFWLPSKKLKELFYFQKMKMEFSISSINCF